MGHRMVFGHCGRVHESFLDVFVFFSSDVFVSIDYETFTYSSKVRLFQLSVALTE
jgi:hypothetical protein